MAERPLVFISHLFQLFFTLYYKCIVHMYFIVRELSEKRDELLNERTNDKNFPNIFRFANLVFYDNYTRCTLSASLYVNCTELLLIGHDIL